MPDRKHRRNPLTTWLYVWVLLKEFRWTIIGVCGLVALGGVVYAFTPLTQLGGRTPSPMASLYAAWMALFAQPPFDATERWHLAILNGVYPLFGFVLIGEGIVRFGLLMLSRRRGEKEWMKVKASTYRDHVVLCGLGRLGTRVLEQLVAQGQDVVALEKDPESKGLPPAKATGIPVLERDMTDDQALIDAGVPHARAIIIATNDDIANLEVALDARRLNPKIRVAMRLYDQKLAGKLSAVFGVDAAFSSSALAAPIVAAMTLDLRVLASFQIAGQPHVAAEVKVEAGGGLCGKSVADVEAVHGVRVLARHNGAGAAESPPPVAAVLAAGDILVVHAAVDKIGVLTASGWSGAG